MDLEEVIKDIEEDQLFTRGVTSKIFKSMLNQPSLVSVNSANALKIESENGYYTFKVDFPRPILDVDTIQLLTTSIPQANASIPDTAITFWYYRLSQYSGSTPSLNNLYCVRLLPSYYKPEFVYNPTAYGWNKTFNNYTDLKNELTKACNTDLGYYNLQNYLIPTQPLDAYLYFPFLPGDITINYNSTYNKFQMTGNTNKLAYVVWNSATPYVQGAVVIYTSTYFGVSRTRAYTSLVNINLNNIPSASPNNWKLTTNEIVAVWKNNATYLPGNIVRVNGTLYKALQRNTEISPPNVDYWGELVNGNDAYNYLITGYDDPNVAIMQGKLFDMPYEPSYYYQTGDRMKYKNRVFEALTENNSYAPGNVNFYPVASQVVYYEGNYIRQIPNTPVQNWTVLQPNATNLPLWNQYTQYAVGDLAYYNGRLYRCKLANINIIPTNFSRWVIQAEHPFDATNWIAGSTYPENSLVYRNNFIWICVVPTTTNTPGSTAAWVAIGRTRWKDFNYQDADTPSVYFNGRYYSRNDTAFNNIQPVPAWNTNTFYATNTFVSNNEAVYRCVIPNQANEPPSPTDTWDNSTLYEINDTVIENATEYRSNVINLNAPPTGLIEWDDMASYLEYEIVIMIGIGTYRARRNVPPGQPAPNVNSGDGEDWTFLSNFTTPSVIWTIISTWEKIGVSNWDEVVIFNDRPKGWNGGYFYTEMSGLNGLSENCDFIDNTGGANVKPDFPRGIPGQPFNIAPERLLNSILGFTWNGIFVPSTLSNLYPDVIAGKFITLYNRLRPVPNYDVEENELLGDPPDPPPTATVTTTYTAEGYANLVYSSIVNIYTNIVGGSTLDTVRNTNLVATTSMNCGNLGIAFHGNYIDTPLQRVAGDINELTIELRDEVGEPFYLTNNAIMTATFKVTYKDGNVRIEEPA